MQYLLMCCFDEGRWNALPASERDDIMRDYGQWMAELDRRGQHLATHKLAPLAAATTVRERMGRSVVTDGPFAETREQLGGVHLLECKDLDEALALARRIPTLRAGGVVEVRPLERAEHGG
jgi:hypothetical protein